MKRYLSLSLNLRTLKWLGVLLPTAFLVGYELLRHLWLDESFHRTGDMPAMLLLVGAVILFTQGIFRLLDPMQRRALAQNEQLTALNAIAAAVSGSLRLDEVLRLALDKALELRAGRAGGRWMADQPGSAPTLHLQRDLPPALRSQLQASSGAESATLPVSLTHLADSPGETPGAPVPERPGPEIGVLKRLGLHSDEMGDRPCRRAVQSATAGFPVSAALRARGGGHRRVAPPDQPDGRLLGSLRLEDRQESRSLSLVRAP